MAEHGVVPQVLPVFLSQSHYFRESNTRVAYMVLLILIVVFIFDNISNARRSRLIGGY